MQPKSPIRALILDMDGVLWKDKEPIGDLPAIFTRLQSRNIRVILATNNATRTPDQYVQKLARFGVVIDPGSIITSANATAHKLKKNFPEGGPVFIIGEEGLIMALGEQGFWQAKSHDHPLAVVAGLDLHITYEKLKQATLLIRSGVPFYFTNPDRTFPTPQGLIPGAGSIMAALVTATDVQPHLAGKPSPDMYLMAMERLNMAAQEVLAVGDRLETDILGGQRAGCQTGLVLSGVATQMDLAEWEPKPDFVAANLDQLTLMI